MEQATQLFGYLILTALGFVLPVMSILLSLFHQGMEKLAGQYEAERTQSETNIKEQLKKMSEAKDIDESAIKQSIKELESIKKTAENKLSYLNPKKQIARLFIPIVIAFLGVLVTLFLATISRYFFLLLLLSIVSFIYAVVALWKLISIIVEVRRILDAEKRDTDSKVIELLSVLAEKTETAGQYYLKNVHACLNDSNINNDSLIVEAKANGKLELKIGVSNSESRMAKNLEIGFILPNNFIVEKTGYHSIFRDEKQQIIRYQTNMLQGHTYNLFDPLIITPLEKGDYIMRTFIKAENVEANYRDVTIRVN